MSKKRENENPFIKEVEDALRSNPLVDMDLFRRWQEIEKILDSLPKEPEPKPKKRSRFVCNPFRLKCLVDKSFVVLPILVTECPLI